MTRIRTVKELIHDHGGTLTPAERQLSSVLLRDYPVAGLQSITKLAEATGVSTPTVIRMARKLGFDGYPELQSALRDEASARMKEPMLKRAGWSETREAPPAFRLFAEAVFDNLHQMIDRLDHATFEAIAEILADTDRRLFLTGGRITRSNADYFFNHLQIIRPNVMLLSQSPNVWPQYLLDMDGRAVLIVFDIRRYESDLAKLAALAKERDATIVLFTDLWGSPISSTADHVVNAVVEVPSSWDSTLAINLILEALIADVQARCSEAARERIEDLEEMFGVTRIFRKTA